jgi:hypothetical protein
MPFDPTKPANDTPVNSLEMRNQLNALKALIDALQAQVNGLLPAGILVGWPKNRANMPALPGTWVECNGQTLNDPDSPFHGQTIDDLNGVSGPRRFLRGATTSGDTGGADSHTHQMQDLDGDHGNFTSVSTSTNDVNALVPGTYTTQESSTLPSYYHVVWVMRVK